MLPLDIVKSGSFIISNRKCKKRNVRNVTSGKNVTYRNCKKMISSLFQIETVKQPNKRLKKCYL